MLIFYAVIFTKFRIAKTTRQLKNQYTGFSFLFSIAFQDRAFINFFDIFVFRASIYENELKVENTINAEYIILSTYKIIFLINIIQYVQLLKIMMDIFTWQHFKAFSIFMFFPEIYVIRHVIKHFVFLKNFKICEKT